MVNVHIHVHLICMCICMHSTEKCEDSFLSLFNSLAIPVPPTRGKFNFQSILVQEVSVSRVLACNPNLPDDLLKMMGHQALACHVRHIYCHVHVGVVW